MLIKSPLFKDNGISPMKYSTQVLMNDSVQKNIAFEVVNEISHMRSGLWPCRGKEDHGLKHNLQNEN